MSQGRKGYYVLVGDSETWKVAIHNRIWGFSEKSKGNWNTIGIGDYLAFYVISPIKKIIGFGKITEKYVDITKTWPDELLFMRSIWMYRIKFETLYVLDNWTKGITLPNNILLNVGRKKVEKNLYYSIISKAQTSWKTNIVM